MTSEPRAAAAEGLAHRKFALAAGGAREQKAGDVHARKHQDRENREQQHPGSLTTVATLPIANGAYADVDLLAIGNGSLRERALQHGLERGGGLRGSPAGAEAGEGAKQCAVVGSDLRGFVELLGEENVESAQRRHDEILGKNPDDFDGCVVERNGKAEDVRLASVARLPKIVGQQSDSRSVRLILIAREITSNDWLHAEQRKEREFDVGAREPRGIGLGQIAILIARKHGRRRLRRRESCRANTGSRSRTEIRESR